jgi:hypothetical protein
MPFQDDGLIWMCRAGPAVRATCGLARFRAKPAPRLDSGLDTGSRHENASNQESRAFSFRFFEMEKALVEIFREGANTRRGPKGVSLDPGLARDDRDDPPRRFDRFVFQYRSNVTRDRRSAGLDGSSSAVELRDTETPNFFLVGRLERKHEALLCSRNYYQLVLSVGENSKP